MFIDTHTHLYVSEFAEDRDAMVKRALEAGVQRMYLPNIDLESIESLQALVQAYPEHMFPMMGLHPCSVDGGVNETLQQILTALDAGPYVAIGEIGLDFYWDKTWIKEQEAAFLQQVEWAIERGLPIVMHSRDAMDRLLELLPDFRDLNLRGVFHCFSGSVEQGRKAIDMGFMLGIGGVATFKNSTLPDVLPKLGLEYLVLETDSPYLAPVPYRGKRNESSYLPVIAHKVSEILAVPLSKVEAVTTKNALELFTVAD